MTFLGVVRTESTPGRGGAVYSTFVYDKAKQDPPLTPAGPIHEDVYWERITYFLNASCRSPRSTRSASPAIRRIRHAARQRIPGRRDRARQRRRPEALRQRSPRARIHGLNFCQGTVAEMLEKPGEQIFDVIRWFGTRKKIFNVHFRNIRGGFLDFRGDVHRRRATSTC